ncbi:MAG TPA: PilZ domain-containing protein [Candidatus Sulfotelmatobacter sp.]|nr:PilZ domain-containing protein [Candidatus Sulfotelmatobacter sp.]
MESREPQVSEFEFVERRRDERVNQPESVKVWVGEPGTETEFQAVLVNISCSGFAIRHWRKELSVGQRVRIALAKGEIVARVMWNWAVGPVVISGLERVQSAPVIGFGPRSHITPSGAISRSNARAWFLVAGTGLLVVIGWYLTNQGW